MQCGFFQLWNLEMGQFLLGFSRMQQYTPFLKGIHVYRKAVAGEVEMCGCFQLVCTRSWPSSTPDFVILQQSV